MEKEQPMAEEAPSAPIFDQVIHEAVRSEVPQEPSTEEPTPSQPSETQDSQPSSDASKLRSMLELPYYEKRIRCPDCKYYTAENEEKMMRHIRKMHRGENPFQCYMCDYSTSNKVCFEEHVRVHQGIKPYKCAFCPHRTVSKKNMKKHELIHRPDNPLKCQECSYIGRHKKALAFHQKKYHIEYTEVEAANFENVLVCNRCGVKFEALDALRSHNKSQRKCRICGYIACSTALRTIHELKKHGHSSNSMESYKPRRKKKKEETFKCVVCKWSSSHPARVLLHLIHHPNQPVDEGHFDLTVLRKHGIVK